MGITMTMTRCDARKTAAEVRHLLALAINAWELRGTESFVGFLWGGSRAWEPKTENSTKEHNKYIIYIYICIDRGGTVCVLIIMIANDKNNGNNNNNNN